MEIFRSFIAALAVIPAWVPLFLYPAVLVLFTVLVLVFGGRRAFYPVAVALGGAAFTLLACKGELAEAFAFLGLYAALSAVCRLFFAIPPRSRKGREKGKKLSRDERMYEKFRPATAEKRRTLPPKVCQFEEEVPVSTAADCGMRLKYAEELLSRLKTASLTPADRLEAEALSHTIGAYGTRPLTAGEIGTLNDCLSSVLKMTAKYKL